VQPTVKPVESSSSDIISYDEWIRLRKIGAGKAHNGFLMGRNSHEADLNVPTVIREKKYINQGELGG
jgi:hypothetical protein